MNQHLEKIVKQFRLAHYRSLFAAIREKAGSLSATEAFSAEVIYLLGSPTVREFSDFLNISQPNASYKVSSLVQKGYIQKANDGEDKREWRLGVTEKFMNYYGRQLPLLEEKLSRLRAKLTLSERRQMDRFLVMLAED